MRDMAGRFEARPDEEDGSPDVGVRAKHLGRGLECGMVRGDLLVTP